MTASERTGFHGKVKLGMLLQQCLFPQEPVVDKHLLLALAHLRGAAPVPHLINLRHSEASKLQVKLTLKWSEML